jgi:hypothetical protein
MPKTWEEGGKDNHPGRAAMSQELRTAGAPSRIHGRGSTRAPCMNGPGRSASRPSACTRQGFPGRIESCFFSSRRCFPCSSRGSRRTSPVPDLAGRGFSATGTDGGVQRRGEPLRRESVRKIAPTTCARVGRAQGVYSARLHSRSIDSIGRVRPLVPCGGGKSGRRCWRPRN